MPELPEVETVRSGLEPVLKNAVIKTVILNRADLRFPFPKHFARNLQGAKIIAVERRAKYLLFRLDNHLTLLAHLGMSGRFRVETSPPTRKMNHGAKSIDPGLFYDQSAQNQTHDHVIVHFIDGQRLIYNDARRFGFMELLNPDDAVLRFSGIGLEPLTPALNAASLMAGFQGKAMAVKPALLDQQVLAGIGNIYACEALFDAKINPRLPAGQIKSSQAKPLVASLKKVLKKAIRLGGSTLRDFKDSEGKSGAFQHEFLVYDRAGQPCLRCGHEIERFVQAGRSTFWCSHCQG